jgi:hypothetical protein
MILSSLTAESILYGPVPVGRESKATLSASTRALGTILTTERRSRASAVACLSVITTVLSSTLAIDSTNGRKVRYSEALAGSSTRWKEKTTSSAVTGVPSWKTAPSRNTAVMVLPLTVGSSAASAAYTSRVTGSSSTSPSRTCQFAATVTAPVVVIGSNPVERA